MLTDKKLEALILHLCIILLLLTTAWIVLMILSMRDYGLIDSMQDALVFVMNADWVFYLNYINAAIITIATTLLFSMLYLYFRQQCPVLSMCAIVFVPVYAAYNLFSYTSQISIVQQIQVVYDNTQYADQIPLLLSQLVQAWNHSSVAFINHFAYAVLGIPSVCFGIALIREPVTSRIAGWFLILNGIACFIGIIGIMCQNIVFSMGSAVGGVLYLIFLLFMIFSFYKKRQDVSAQT